MLNQSWSRIALRRLEQFAKDTQRMEGVVAVCLFLIAFQSQQLNSQLHHQSRAVKPQYIIQTLQGLIFYAITDPSCTPFFGLILSKAITRRLGGKKMPLTVTDRVREQVCIVAKSRNLSKPSSSERYMAKTSPEKISARRIINFPELRGFKVWGRRRRPKTSKINFWP